MDRRRRHSSEEVRKTKDKKSDKNDRNDRNKEEDRRNKIEEIMREKREEARKQKSDRNDKSDRSDREDKSDRNDRVDKNRERLKSEQDKNKEERKIEKEKRRLEYERLKLETEKRKIENEKKNIENIKEQQQQNENKEQQNKGKEEESVEIVNENQQEDPHKNLNIDENTFMFVFEDKNGKLYNDINKITKDDKDEIKIFPVYFQGCDENLNEDVVTYDVKTNKLVPSEQEGSWLNILNDEKSRVIQIDAGEIIVYNNKLFHCEYDVQDYIQHYGYEVLPLL